MEPAAVVDTNVVVSRFDPRFPAKQTRAEEVLRKGIEAGYAIPHQVLLEAVADLSRPQPVTGAPLLTWWDAPRGARDGPSGRAAPSSSPRPPGAGARFRGVRTSCIYKG